MRIHKKKKGRRPIGRPPFSILVYRIYTPIDRKSSILMYKNVDIFLTLKNKAFLLNSVNYFNFSFF